MELRHIYKGFAVYYDKESQKYMADGYNEKKSSAEELHSYIDDKGIFPILSDSAVVVMYKLGYFRVSFLIEYENLVKQEKWSNGETELIFHYDNVNIDVKGKINPQEFMQIIRKVGNFHTKKDNKTVFSNIIQGHLKAHLTKKGKIANLKKTSDIIAKGIVSHIEFHNE
ncbi:hypothetical protein R3O67_29485 [Bacillus cereus]|uniref:hypothetical protein n=1 Tax=Bacillus cereus TaxID=1396 RepID=UPI003078EEF3